MACDLLQGVRASCHLLRHVDQTDSAEFCARVLCVLRGAEMVETVQSDTVARQVSPEKQQLNNNNNFPTFFFFLTYARYKRRNEQNS